MRLSRSLSALLLSAAFGACATGAGAMTDPSAPPALEALWTADGFSNPEGVARASDGAYFISNVAGEGAQKDGAGWISKLSADGKIINAKFIDGLDAPKGMAVLNGQLHVTDISAVRVYDARTGAAIASYDIEGAKFLNDAVVWRGAVFVSDSGTARIWTIGAAGPELWREDEEMRGVNGLTADGDRLLISTMTGGDLFEATAGGGWRKIATGMADADGVGLVPGGGYLVSAWPGEIFFVSEGGAVTSLLNTREAKIYQNDLTMIGDTVIVPNWEPGSVTAWKAVR